MCVVSDVVSGSGYYCFYCGAELVHKRHWCELDNYYDEYECFSCGTKFVVCHDTFEGVVTIEVVE